jgi:hypothetical protein
VKKFCLAAVMLVTAACQKPNLEPTEGGYGGVAAAATVPADTADTAVVESAPDTLSEGPIDTTASAPADTVGR